MNFSSVGIQFVTKCKFSRSNQDPLVAHFKIS
jgi:hypothetical protein